MFATPAPVSLRTVPVLLNRFVPPLAKMSRSTSTSKVAPGRLLNVPFEKTRLFVTL